MLEHLTRWTRGVLLVVASAIAISRSVQAQGTITGVLTADSTGEALASVNIVLLHWPDSSSVAGTISDDKGIFRIENVPNGKYELRYSLLGYETRRSAAFTIDSQRRLFDAGAVRLKETAVRLGDITVTSQKPLMTAAIDRKVYAVQQDLVSATGSVSDLLQNIPSVQVDVDGTVSLRGSPNVQILINGKPSPLTTGGSADVLQQIPASTVESIEVITNPSAKFKPEGTSGLINIVLRKETNLGLNGNVGGNVGNSSRYNASANGNYKPGAFNVNGTYNFRQDERNTYTTDQRLQRDSATSVQSGYNQNARAFARPYTHYASLGLEYALGDAGTFGASGNFRRRAYTSTDTTHYLLTGSDGTVTSQYDRRRIDYDQTPVVGASAFYQQDFLKGDHTLRLEFTASHLFDEEDNHFTNVFRVPAGFVTYDNRRINEHNDERELTVDYHRKIDDHSVLEAGYDGTFNKNDFPFMGSYYDSTRNAFVTDTELTNHFGFHETIHAVYCTYEQTIGALSVMGGLRLENARITSDLITAGTSVATEYVKLYPTLHLAHKLNEFNELQLNYSLRANRPDGGDLNPFPEYQNPRSLRAGNPHLLPELIHSVEFGCQIQNDILSVTPSIFYRNRHNGFTSITKALNDSTLLTTDENLSKDQSGGVELVVAGTVLSIVSLNISGNAFYEEIDASNLGYTGRKSVTSWNASVNCNMHFTKGTMVQVNSNYRSSRLTPQGEVSPGFVLNLGLRHDLIDDKLAIVATVSDVFATLNRKTNLNTDRLTQNAVISRDSRVAFLGLTYHFGSGPQKQKDKPLQYEDNG